MNNRLALGTVQFGTAYGIANRSGQVGRAEAAAILADAWSAGLDTLDTAINYGQSEQRLGDIGVGRWRVVSKLPAWTDATTNIATHVRQSLAGSLERLRLPRLYGLLLHRPQQLLGPNGPELYRVLEELRDEGKVEKIGVSVYAPDELDALWARYQFDLVQLPFNVVDRRFAASGWLLRLHQAGTEIHARSVFLQGLLLMTVNRPDRFDRWGNLWDQWQAWLSEHRLTALQACLGFALSHPEIDRIVFGVDSLAQLREVLESARPIAARVPATLTSADLELVDPSRWGSA